MGATVGWKERELLGRWSSSACVNLARKFDFELTWLPSYPIIKILLGSPVAVLTKKLFITAFLKIFLYYTVKIYPSNFFC